MPNTTFFGKVKDKVQKAYAKRYTDFPKPLRKGKLIFCYSMVLVPLIGFVVFYVGINLNSIILAFRKFVGYDSEFNEVYEFSFYQFQRFWNDLKNGDSIIWLALKNTMLYFIVGIVMTPIQVMTAYFLYKKIRWSRFFVIVFFLPNIISSVTMVTMYKSIIDSAGPIAYVLELLFGYQLPKLLYQDSTAMMTILAYTIWLSVPGNMVLLIGSMSRVSEDMLEAGKLDGCGFFREMWNLVLPCIWGTLSTLMIMKFASIFTSSGPILLFSNGQYNTSTLSFFIYNEVKNNGSYEYPSAVGLIFTCIGMPIAIFTRWLSGKIYADVEY